MRGVRAMRALIVRNGASLPSISKYACGTHLSTAFGMGSAATAKPVQNSGSSGTKELRTPVPEA